MDSSGTCLWISTVHAVTAPRGCVEVRFLQYWTRTNEIFEIRRGPYDQNTADGGWLPEPIGIAGRGQPPCGSETAIGSVKLPGAGWAGLGGWDGPDGLDDGRSIRNRTTLDRAAHDFRDMSTPSQISLPLLAPARGEDETLVPARMVNEWVYCPRLAYLEWVEGEWADTGDTAQGQRVHRRVDTERGNLPAPEESDQEFARASSVTLSSETLGIIAKMDVVETQDDRVVPVDFKKGKTAARGGRCLRARASPALRPGPDPRRQRLHRDRGRALVRGGRASGSTSGSMKSCGSGRARRSPSFGSPRPPAAARRPSKTAPSAHGARWPASAFPTRPISLPRDSRPVRSTRPTTPHFRSTSRRRGRGSESRESASWWRRATRRSRCR